jgi:hypothetical protein
MQFQTGGGGADARDGALAQADVSGVLRHIAGLRAREAVATGAHVVPWTVVSVQAVRIGADISRPMRVRLLEGKRPLANERVVIERAPHHACSAVTGADGAAECILQDMHGTGHVDDEDEGNAPVVASYPGKVEREIIKLPTAVPFATSKPARRR